MRTGGLCTRVWGPWCHFEGLFGGLAGGFGVLHQGLEPLAVFGGVPWGHCKGIWGFARGFWGSCTILRGS